MLIIIRPRPIVVAPPEVDMCKCKYVYSIHSSFSPFFEVISDRSGIQQDVHLKGRLVQAPIVPPVIRELDQLDFVNITEAVEYSPKGTIHNKHL